MAWLHVGLGRLRGQAALWAAAFYLFRSCGRVLLEEFVCMWSVGGATDQDMGHGML